MELIFFPLTAICLIAAAILKRKEYIYFVIGSFILFGASVVHCLFDVAQRATANDLAGIADIYPTMKWAYLIALAVVAAFNVIIVMVKKQSKA